MTTTSTSGITMMLLLTMRMKWTTLEYNNYDSVYNNDIQMLVVEQNLDTDAKKATISSFEWS